MLTPTDTEKSASPSGQEARTVDLSRRKLGMGLGVSAIFTLSSRPVLAVECMAGSSVASGNTSTNGPALTCTGLTPEQWVAHAQDTFPSNPNHQSNNGFPSGNPKFHEVFSGTIWDNARLYEVMADGVATTTQGGMLTSATVNGSSGATSPSGANPISAEFAATLLNIRDLRIPSAVLGENGLLGMWIEWMDTGTYSPMAGASWNTDQIVTYLRTLQGA